MSRYRDIGKQCRPRSDAKNARSRLFVKEKCNVTLKENTGNKIIKFIHYRGWSGGAKVLGKLPVPGRPTILITVGQGPTALAVGAGGGCLDIFTLIYPFSSLSPSLWETSRYRLYGKWLFTWLSLMMSLMVPYFVLFFFVRDVLDEIWDLSNQLKYYW